MKETKVIELKDLTKSYGKARGIVDVNLEIYEGEIFGFIGPNGAGKSTTIRTLLGMIFKTRGEMKVFGLDPIKDKEEVLSEIGYLPSEVFYYDNMKAIELFNYSASFYKKDCSQRISELAVFFDLDLNKKIEDMSLGNKKKVGIIQGLLHSPKLIILDEPTSGLDPLMQQKFFRLLKEENQKGVTILFSSHILSEVQKICDRVGIIKEGRIVEVKKINELTHSTYKRISFTVHDMNAYRDIKCDGIFDYLRQDATITFLYKGDINFILKEISAVKLKNIDIAEPSLEEIFMHHYESQS